MKHDDKNSAQPSDTSKKNLRIKTSTPKPAEGSELPCQGVIW